MRSTAPAVIATVAQRTRADSVVRLSGILPVDSLVLSLELIGRLHDARVRFAAQSPGPLRNLPRGTVALSTPALLHVRSGAEPVAHADSAIALLLASTTLRAERRMGLFWESYGFADTEAVDISVQVHRLDTPGRFERITASLGLTDRESSGTEIRWRETRPGTPADSTGPVSIHGRSVLLNLSGLRTGAYVVAVTVRTLDGRSASSVRHFDVE